MRIEDSIPFIPTEQEVDALISAGGRKLGTFLLMLKETGARTGELMKGQWINLDPETGVLDIRPEEEGRARQVKLFKSSLAEACSNNPSMHYESGEGDRLGMC